MSEPGKSDKNDDDPGFWYRGMSRRGQLILVILSSAVVVGGLLYALLNGIRFF